MFGQTLKQAQLKALQEFSATLYSITESLKSGTAPPLVAVQRASSNAGSGGGGAPRSADGSGRTAAAAARALFPPGCGCGPASPEAFYRVREAAVQALTSLAAAFKPSHPALARAIKGAVEGLEDTGMFD